MFKAEWTNKDSLDLQQTCNKLATNLQPTEGDIISREGAIECIRWGESVTDVIDRIKALPSADTVSREFYNDAVKANIRLVIENGKLKEQIESADAVTIHEDGTLEVTVPNALKVGRVLVIDTDSHIGGGLFYPDEAVPQSEQYKRGFEDAKRAFELEFAREAESIRKRNAQLEVMLNAQKAISAEAEPKWNCTANFVAEQLDRLRKMTDEEKWNFFREFFGMGDAVQGEWILVKGSNGKDYHKCSKCLHTQEITGVKNYCAVCGAVMKDGDDE